MHDNTNFVKNDNVHLSLVIPCYNEENNITNTATRLIQTFQKEHVNLELIIVDNGSTDRTGILIDEMIDSGLPIKKVVVDVNVGYGNGVISGLTSCSGDLVGFICADGQVEANDVFKVYDIASRSSVPKLVKVRRRFRMDGYKRKIISVIYNFFTILLFGNLDSIDINGNPKIMPRNYLDQMDLISNDWFLDAEVMIKAKRMNLEVYEFNVLGQMREQGKSNVRITTCWEFLFNLIKYRFFGIL